jgi:hypothetical protein
MDKKNILIRLGSVGNVISSDCYSTCLKHYVCMSWCIFFLNFVETFTACVRSVPPYSLIKYVSFIRDTGGGSSSLIEFYVGFI